MRRLSWILLCAPLALFAGESGETHYDRISLSAAAADRVDNDLATVTLSAQEDGGFPSELADKVNQRIKWGVETVKQRPGMKVQTQSYNTQPVYRDNRITGWRVSQAIAVESRDIAGVSELLSVLQSRLNLQGMHFSVSPETREAKENELITRALAAFEKRAGLVAENLKRSGYKLVDLQISTADFAPQPRFMGRAMMAEAAMDVAAPSMEAGESTITVTVSGVVELK
ncbi:MAG: SIMPL domain-containing protein [Thiotrichales bacterium]